MGTPDQIYQEMIATREAREQGLRGRAIQAAVSNPVSREALCLAARIRSEGAAKTPAPAFRDAKLRAANDFD